MCHLAIVTALPWREVRSVHVDGGDLCTTSQSCRGRVQRISMKLVGSKHPGDAAAGFLLEEAVDNLCPLVGWGPLGKVTGASILLSPPPGRRGEGLVTPHCIFITWSLRPLLFSFGEVNFKRQFVIPGVFKPGETWGKFLDLDCIQQHLGDFGGEVA